MKNELPFDPKLDLAFERTSTLSPEQIWKGWTDPTTLMKWFCPRPWKVTSCRIDLRSGGEFFTVMEGPNGEKIENPGCFLEVVKNEKLVWTNLLSKGYRPVLGSGLGFPFVATISLARSANQTLYRAVVTHGDETGRKEHEKMGFQEGWGMAFKQLEEVMKE